MVFLNCSKASEPISDGVQDDSPNFDGTGFDTALTTARHYFMKVDQKHFSFLLACLTVLSIPSQAQNSEDNLWFFWSNKVKLNSHFSLTSDIQVRTADKSAYLNTVLLRPGISYEISESQSVTVGYTYFATWEEENGNRAFDGEHRAWEQYMLDSKAGRVELTNRFRLEQRFFQNESNDFAQRFRYYIRAGIPLVNSKEFDKGFFLSIQNEIFLNIQNKENVNNDFFDQNRVYAGIGYRLSKKAELELGYMYRYQVEEKDKMNNHIVQLMLSTDF